MAEPMLELDMPALSSIPNGMCGTAASEPNDQILRIMQNLGIDASRTRESLKVSEMLSKHSSRFHRKLSFRQTAMIITLPSICCFWSDLRTRTTSTHLMQHQNTHPLSLREDDPAQLQNKQCESLVWEAQVIKGKSFI